ncbi:MAG: branched-chain amino acid ABC transporter permease [Mycobacteriales bacterium]|nr:branched-chain amino acid ABC transporter permease [Frankia sp.]
MLLARIVTGVAVGAAYSLIAVAVVLIYSGTKTLSIAMGELGAFGFFLGLRWHTRGIPLVHTKVSVFTAGLVAVAVGGLLGLAVERLVMRPLVQRPPLDGLIATLGVALFLALLEVQIFGRATQFAPSPVGDGRVTIFRAVLVAPRIAALLLSAVVALGLYLFLNRTKFGLATRAATGDPTVARLLGVKVNSVYRLVWVVGGALSGVAAALLAPAFGGLTPFAQTTFALRALAGAVIGGLDSLWGAILGSLLVGVVESVVGSSVTSGGAAVPGASEAAILVLVIATLVVRPRGLLGTAGAA